MSKKEKVSQKISRELLAMIQKGKFPPGSKLPTEMELASYFQVSRMPIREALSVLKAMGIVSSRQGGGSYVEELTPLFPLADPPLNQSDMETILHVFELRKILEPEAAALASLRRTEEDLQSIKDALKALEEELRSEDKTGEEADFLFHRAIIQATHNPLFIQTWRSLESLYQKTLAITLRQNIGLKMKRLNVYREHENIYLAIEQEEPELAKVQMGIHLKNVEKKLMFYR